MERIQKIMAEAGIGSRRECEKIIESGRVSVNGKTAKLGDKAETSDNILLDGKPIVTEKKIYILLNKPVGCVTTVKEQFGRKTVLEYITGIKERIYPVGRLDYATSGLLILTNDGEFTQKLTHPASEVEKTYIATLDKELSEDNADKLRNGVSIDGRMTAPAKVKLISAKKAEIIIHEGRNRQVRKMCEAVGCKVTALKRVAIGSLTIGTLKPGDFRHLTDDEIRLLYNS